MQQVQAMKSLCLKYQSYIREPDYPSGENLAKRLELADECNDRFRVPPIFLARRLQVAGYAQAAELMTSFSHVVERFSLLTIAWSEDADSVLLNHDIEGDAISLLSALTEAREMVSREKLSDADLKTLVAAADIIENLALYSDDYFFYFEGQRDAHEDDGIDPKQRLAEIKANYDALPLLAVVQQCKIGGKTELASAIERLSAAVSAVVHLPPDAFPSTDEEDQASIAEDGAVGRAVDVSEMSDDIKIKYETAVSALLEVSGLGR